MRFLKKNKYDPNLFQTNPGSRKRKVLAPLFDGKKLSLIESGEVDVQDMINSHAAACDMSFILSRLANGDRSFLNGSNPIFADFHNLPGSFRDVLDIALNSERIFNTLPLEQRQQFDNDYRKFVATAGTAEWNNIMQCTPNVPEQLEKPVDPLDSVSKEV